MTAVRLSWPNRITLARLLLIAPFVICLLYIQEPRWDALARYGALGLYVIMALSDALDGYLARKYRSESALGRFLDPLADKLLITAASILLAGAHTSVPGARLPEAVVVIIISKDLYIVVGFLAIYLISGRLWVQPNRVSKACTALQSVMVAAILAAPEARKVTEYYPIFLNTLWWSVAALAGATALIHTRRGTRFVAEHHGDEA